MDKVVLHHIASDYGKYSSIGFRSQKICEYSKKQINITVICRSNKSKKFTHKNIWAIDLSYLFSRIFSLIRIYFFTNFPARKYELFIFNFLSIPYIIFHFFRNFKKKKYFHSWDSTFWILFFTKKMGYYIIKDCAMTPSKSSLIEAEKNPNFYIDKTTNKKKLISEKKVLQISDKIICPSIYTSNFIIKEYQVNPNKLKTIPFGADPLDKFLLKKRKNNKKIIRLGFVGLVNMRKGIRWLIDVLNYCYENDNLKFELHLFGRIFKEEIDTINAAKFKIIKYGFIDKNKHNIYNSFDILVHPSFIEGSAKCIYEAMASGLPIICTEQSGSLVQNKKNGFVIDAGDSLNLKNAIKFFIINKKFIHIMGVKSQQIISNYSWGKYAEKVTENY